MISIWQHISDHIKQSTGKPFNAEKQQGVSGGCINQVTKVSDGERTFFVKVNHAKHGDMFEAEAQALQEMAVSKTIKVPQPICFGETNKQCYLVLEYLDLTGSANMDEMGRQFAQMHKHTHSQFGWHRDNTIGSTPQVNTYHNDWIAFWRDCRLGFQLELAARNGYGGKLQSLGEKLMADFPALFTNHSPKPSMLHGDLWGGNASGLKDGTPVIYDPAFYYGDREADLAMTQLFGGFGQSFYAAYNDVWPLDDGYATRKVFYNIYHIINHANLFGGGYQSQAISMIEQVLSEI